MTDTSLNRDSAFHRAKRPATPLAGPYGHPFHPTVVMIPVGAWLAAVIFDIVSFAAEDGEPFVVGARWLYAIGILGALVAAVLGLLDYSRLTPGSKVRRTATTHMILNIAALVVFVVVWVLHLGSDDPTVAGLVLGIVGAVGLGISGFLGGELVFRYGSRVADESDQAVAHTPAR